MMRPPKPDHLEDRSEDDHFGLWPVYLIPVGLLLVLAIVSHAFQPGASATEIAGLRHDCESQGRYWAVRYDAAGDPDNYFCVDPTMDCAVEALP